MDILNIPEPKFKIGDKITFITNIHNEIEILDVLWSTRNKEWLLCINSLETSLYPENYFIKST